MIHTDRAIVVEGKYDKIKLSGMIDGVIVCTGGFRIYKDKEMQAMLRTLANKQGLAVLTDPDHAGFLIRGYLKNIAAEGKVYHAYIPDRLGKEKRKAHPSREGKLGVEGIPEQLLQKAFEEAGVGVQQVQRAAQPITKMDLFELGLSGTADSAQRRKQLMRHLNLPEHLTTNALVTVLAALMTREELYSQCSALLTQEEE